VRADWTRTSDKSESVVAIRVGRERDQCATAIEVELIGTQCGGALLRVLERPSASTAVRGDSCLGVLARGLT
jgi:hypothetical protein